MAHLAIELALWILLAFFVGCIVGYIVRSVLHPGNPAVALSTDTTTRATPESPATPGLADPVASADSPAGSGMAVEAPIKPGRPTGIAQARGGKADNLQRISGIGPKNERTLHSLGFYHYDQIAAWTEEEVAWVDDHLKFNGRIVREEWILQASLLAEGKEDEFKRLYGSNRS